MNNNNLDTRKRIFEILNKLSTGYDFQLSPETFSPNNEMIELIEILTNNNPYLSMQPVKIEYDDLIGGNPNTLGAYYTGQNLICYSLPFVQAVTRHNASFIILLDTIYHEQRHHYQDYFRANPELIHSIDFKQVTDGILDGQMSNEEVKELHDFATQHDLLGKIVSKNKIKKLQFGAYLSNKCEIDARNNAFNDTTETFKMMIEDELCSPETKKFLTENYELYADWQIKVKKDNDKTMKSFEHLDKKVKSKLMKAMKSNKPLDEDTYNALLNGILEHITKGLTLKENLEIATWALKNNYPILLHNINLRNSLSSERSDLSNFITDIVSQDLLTADSFCHVCRLFSSFGHKTNDEAINYLVANLADRASIDVLLYHADTGWGGLTFYSKHISPKMLDVALSNYLSKIEHTKTIVDYDKYAQIRDEIMGIQTSKQGNASIKQALLSHVERFKKIDANKQIQIIKKVQQEKEETLSI